MGKSNKIKRLVLVIDRRIYAYTAHATFVKHSSNLHYLFLLLILKLKSISSKIPFYFAYTDLKPKSDSWPAPQVFSLRKKFLNFAEVTGINCLFKIR